jgi:hypothetical protein
MATVELTNAIGANTDTTDPFARLPNESFVDYLKRIKNVRGMLLGQYMPKTEEETATEELTQQPLGEMIVRDQGGDGDGAPDTYDPQAARQFNVERAIGLLTGKATPGPMVGSAVGIPGMLVGGLVDYGAQSALESELEAEGFSKEQIDTIKANPSILEGMMARGELGGFTQKGGYQQGFVDRMPTLGSIVDTILGRGTQADNIRPGYTPFGLDNRTAVPTFGMNPYAAPITAPQQYMGLPQGVVGGGQGYIDSSGQYRNTSNLSNQTVAGLQAVTAGMFETPSWYEDEYTEPSSGGGGGTGIDYQGPSPVDGGSGSDFGGYGYGSEDNASNDYGGFGSEDGWD